MDSPINEHCTTISNQRQTISTGQLKYLFDLIVIELNKSPHFITDDFYVIINTLKYLSGLTLIDQIIINNELFYFIRNFLIDLLNKWSKIHVILIDKDEYLFGEIIEFIFKLIQHIKTTNQVSSSSFQLWFLNEEFFKTIAFVLEDISTNSDQYLNQNQNMKSLSMLIQSILSFQSGNDHIRNNPNVLLLVDPIIKCLSSSIYIETLKQIDIKSTNRTSFEDFILETIPCYSAWNRGQAQLIIINQLCLNNMLKSYQDIYHLFLPSIDDWEYSLMQSIYYMTALLRYVPYYPSTREYLNSNLKIIDSILILLNSNCLLDNILITTDYNSKTNIIDSAISFIFNLTHDFHYLSLIKENSFFSKDIFLKLKNSKVDRVKLHAFMILAKILNEEDIQKLDYTHTLTLVFFNYLFRAVNDPCHSCQDVPVEHLLASLKGNTLFIGSIDYFHILYRQIRKT
jgi:hypothetical protein